jgi:DNA polymerase III epsilon subunit-like protein
MEIWATIDTETTGLPDQDWSRVVELAAILRDGEGNILRTYETLVSPDVLTVEGLDVAKRISNISESDIRSGKDIKTVWQELGDFLDGWTYPVRAWNTEFDQDLLRKTFRDRNLPDKINWGGCIMWDFTRKRQFQAGFRRNGSIRPFSLKRAAALLKFEWEGNPHRAMTDTLMASKIDHHMASLHATPLPKVGVIRIGDIAS